MADQIPTIKNRIAERLSSATPRNEAPPISFGDSEGSVELKTPSERGAVVLACLVLESLREQGGSRVPGRALEQVMRKCIGTLGAKEMMDIEIEAYELLLWLGEAIDPNWQPGDNDLDPATIDPQKSQTDLVRWAIAAQVDLELDYFSAARGELTHRRITPISFEAEKYLHAYCHWRHGERVFRISRIAELRPVGGFSKKAAKKRAPVEEESDGPSPQIDLWGKA